MRKHFLILMLLTLLPLAGWAQGAGTGDIRQATVYIEPFGYGGFDLDDVTAENPATITPATGLNIRITDGSGVLTEGVEYTVSNEFYIVNDNEEPIGVSLINDYTQLPVGKYAVKITGINTYNNGYSVYGIFEVKRPILLITFEDGEGNAWGDIKKLYGTSDKQPYQIDGLTIKATVKNSAYNDGEDDHEALEIELTDAQKQAIVYTRAANENANATAAGVYFNATAEPESAGTGYALEWSGLTGDNVANYTIQYPDDVELMIKQETILAVAAQADAAGFHMNPTTLANQEYDGTEKVPSFTVTFKNTDLFAGTNAKPVDNLTTGNQYTLSYTYSTTQNGNYEAVATPRNAGYYKVFVNGKANGNYYTAQGVQYGTFQITKAAADVIVIAKTKVYDGKAFTFDAEEAAYLAPEFSISGLVASDEGKVDLTTLTAEAANNVNLTKNVGSYSIVANVEEAKIVYGTNNSVDLLDNYDVTLLPNNWTITKKTLKITASDKTVALDAELSADLSELTFDGSVESEEAEDDDPSDNARLEDAFKIVLAEGASSATAGEFANTFVVTRKAAADYDDKQEVPASEPTEYTSESFDAAAAILANYDFETEGNITNGTLTVESANFTIRPIIAANLQYGTVPAPTFYAYIGQGAQATVLTADDIDADNIEYQYSNDGGETWSETVPKNVYPSYKVKIVAKDATKGIGKGNYAKGQATTPAVQFAINPKVIDITVEDVLLWEGATKTILQQKGDVDFDETQLVNWGETEATREKINFEYDFVAPEEGDKYAIDVDETTGEKTLSFLEGYDNDNAAEAITVVLVAKEGFNNANYSLNITKGELLQTDLANLELELDGDATKVEDAIAITKANTELNLTYDVTIKGRTLSKDVWNTLVLPFDVDPLEFCNEINDYAVFNTLTSANGAVAKFSLARTTIPAHTPFLVKPTKDINFDATHTVEVEQVEVAVRDYIFEGVTIKEGTPVKPVGDGEFVGTYKSITLSEGDGVYVPYGGKFITLAQGKKISGLESIPMGWTTAYLNLNVEPGTEARITVEEADGSTTAISGITADGVAVKAEGWYTLDGIKLNAAPTEKGVYINNGKKVVLK